MADQPEHLYRYRALNGYSHEDVERILAHGQIRFSSPEWFNDPFDCRLPPAIDGIEAEKGSWLEESYVPTTYPALARAERAQAVEKLMSSVDDLAIQHVQYTLRKLIPNSGVLSLSETPDDIVIWSHYADSHRGVCLKFDRSKLKFVQVFEEHYGEPYQRKDDSGRHEESFEAAPVDYAESVPTIRLFRDPRQAWGASVFTKSKHWSYECEWSVLVPPPGDAAGYGWHPLPPDALAGVIFGCEIRPEDEGQVREWVKMGGGHVPLFRAEKKSGRFELEIREIG